MSLFQRLILKKVEWRHTLFFSFDVNEILVSSYKKIREILGKQFGESRVETSTRYSDSGRCQTSTQYCRATRVLGIYNDGRKLCCKVACGDVVVGSCCW